MKNKFEKEKIKKVSKQSNIEKVFKSLQSLSMSSKSSKYSKSFIRPVSVHSADHCIETMSLVNFLPEIRKVVLEHFIAHCEKVGSDIDMVELLALSGGFCEVPPPPPVKSRKWCPPGVKVDKKTVVTEPENFKRMPKVVNGKCMARTWAKGCGTQCTHNTCVESDEYCTRHMKSAAIAVDESQPFPALGRIDHPRRVRRYDPNPKLLKWAWYNGDGLVEEVDEVPVEDDKAVEEVPVIEVPVDDVKVEEDTQDGDFPKKGIYQGVTYQFGKANIHGEHPVQTMVEGYMKVVGVWDDEEVVLNEDYESTHIFSITGDVDQVEVIWL